MLHLGVLMSLLGAVGHPRLGKVFLRVRLVDIVFDSVEEGLPFFLLSFAFAADRLNCGFVEASERFAFILVENWDFMGH